MDQYKKFDQFIVTEVNPYVAHVQINRSKSYNSFDTNTWTQFGELFRALDEDINIKAIILSGVGRHFCSGLDIKSAFNEFSSFGSGDGTQLMHRHIIEFQKQIGEPVKIDTPTIAVLHGLSIGLAMDILGTIPIAVCSQDVKLSIREIAIGIVADIGSLQRLPQKFSNNSRLYEYALTGEFFGSKEAMECGIVSHVESDKDSALAKSIEIASKIAQHDRNDIRATKRFITQMNEIGVEEGLANIARYNSIHLDPKTVMNKIKRTIKL